MPESYGKRQRKTAKANKAAAREERRVARAQRNADRAAGLIEGRPGGLPFSRDGAERQPGWTFVACGPFWPCVTS
jgi:hypothetical protein